MKKDLFNRWTVARKEGQVILLDDNQNQHIQVKNHVYFYDKKDDNVYMFGTLKHYQNTRV